MKRIWALGCTAVLTALASLPALDAQALPVVPPATAPAAGPSPLASLDPVLMDDLQIIGALSAYNRAQSTYMMKNYAQLNQLPKGTYAPSFRNLGGPEAHKDAKGQPLTLLDEGMIAATAEKPWHGYYFVDMKGGNRQFDHGLFAVPARADSGKLTLAAHMGIVWLKDTAGKVPPTLRFGEWEKAGWILDSTYLDQKAAALPRAKEPIAPAVANNYPGIFTHSLDDNANVLYPIQDGEKQGAIDGTGKIVVPVGTYGMIFGSHNGLTRVGNFNGSHYMYGYIDPTGKLVIPCVYDMAEDFSCGRAWVAQKDHWGAIDKTGKVIIPATYGFQDVMGHSFLADRALVQIQGKYAVIDVNGTFLTGPLFDSPPHFAYPTPNIEIVPFEQGGKWGYMNLQRQALIPPVFERAEPFDPDLAQVSVGGRVGLIDTHGKLVVPPLFERMASRFTEGFAWYSNGRKYGYLDRFGAVAIPAQFEHADPFADGRALVALESGRKYAFIDTTGKVVIPGPFAESHSFRNGLAAVHVGDKWGFVNPAGEMAIEATYGAVSDFIGPLAHFQDSASNAMLGYGYINKEGKVVWRASPKKTP